LARSAPVGNISRCLAARTLRFVVLHARMSHAQARAKMTIVRSGRRNAPTAPRVPSRKPFSKQAK
jgi:hypothetical protein